jgi:predicted lipid-binding transport protein (Tim44 family)
VDAFRASTADIATPAVSDALSPVDGDLERLADAVDGAAMVDDPVHAVQSARDAMADLQDSWGGALARVCA